MSINNLGCLSRIHPLIRSVAPESNGSNGGPNRAVRRRLATVQEAADYLAVTPRTIRNYVSQGYFPGYRIARTRGIRVDLSEVDRAMRMIPAAKAHAGYGAYGPNATIVALPPQPVRVEAYVPAVENEEAKP